MAQWKDPDDDVVHIINSMGTPTRTDESRAESTLHMLGIDTPDQPWSRIVTMRCGARVFVDSNDSIRYENHLIARPWVTSQDAPTCLGCVTAVDTPATTDFYNAWGIKGA